MRWIRPEGAGRSSYRFKCSSCGKICHQVTGNCGRKQKVDRPDCTYRFCPWCGEKMEEVVEMDKYKDLIERLRAEADILDDEYKRYKQAELYDEAADAIEELLKREWIPVSERLPEKNGKYLVCGRQNAVNILTWQEEHWYGRWGVVAWMPLPEPYKGEV